VEKKIDGIGARTDDSLTETDKRIEAIGRVLSSLGSKLAGLDSKISTMDGRIITTEEKQKKLSTALQDSLQQNTQQLMVQLKKLNTNFETLKGSLAQVSFQSRVFFFCLFADSNNKQSSNKTADLIRSDLEILQKNREQDLNAFRTTSKELNEFLMKILHIVQMVTLLFIICIQQTVALLFCSFWLFSSPSQGGHFLTEHLHFAPCDPFFLLASRTSLF
jgi:hypothetical protein